MLLSQNELTFNVVIHFSNCKLLFDIMNRKVHKSNIFTPNKIKK